MRRDRAVSVLGSQARTSFNDVSGLSFPRPGDDCGREGFRAGCVCHAHSLRPTTMHKTRYATLVAEVTTTSKRGLRVLGVSVSHRKRVPRRPGIGFVGKTLEHNPRTAREPVSCPRGFNRPVCLVCLAKGLIGKLLRSRADGRLAPVRSHRVLRCRTRQRAVYCAFHDVPGADGHAAICSKP